MGKSDKRTRTTLTYFSAMMFGSGLSYLVTLLFPAGWARAGGFLAIGVAFLVLSIAAARKIHR